MANRQTPETTVSVSSPAIGDVAAPNHVETFERSHHRIEVAIAQLRQLLETGSMEVSDAMPAPPVAESSSIADEANTLEGATVILTQTVDELVSRLNGQVGRLW